MGRLLEKGFPGPWWAKFKCSTTLLDPELAAQGIRRCRAKGHPLASEGGKPSPFSLIDILSKYWKLNIPNCHCYYPGNSVITIKSTSTPSLSGNQNLCRVPHMHIFDRFYLPASQIIGHKGSYWFSSLIPYIHHHYMVCSNCVCFYPNITCIVVHSLPLPVPGSH